MSLVRISLVSIAFACGATVAVAAFAQQSKQPAAPKQPAAKQPVAKQPAKAAAPAAKGAAPAEKAPAAGQKATAPDSAADAARKSQILHSPQWRRAMFEFTEWLSGQSLYDAKQVAQIKHKFANQVAKASADELQFMLDDMYAKFQILDSEPAKEAREWMASYLSVMSDKKREQVIQEIPDIATMTAGQLGQVIQKIEAKRAGLEREQAAFARQTQEEVNTQLQTDRIRQAEYSRAMNNPPQSFSPYRQSNAPGEPPFSNRNLNGGMGFYVTPWGGVGMMFSPSSF